MNLLKWGNRSSFSQPILYGSFFFLLLLPSLVLALSEPMSLWASIASVLFPAALYSSLLLLFRKPGYFLLFSTWLLIINIGQIVQLSIFGESVISPDMFLNMVTTNAGESGELLGTIWPIVVSASVFYLAGIGMGIYSLRSTEKLSVHFIRRALSLSVVMLLIGGVCLAVDQQKGFQQRIDQIVYPINALYNLRFAVEKYDKNTHYAESSHGFTFNASKLERSEKREVYLLVIGETTRAMNWQLYGYPRETNPRLSQIEHLVVFPDVVTQANITHKSVPMILSNASAEDYNIIYAQKSLITAFKEVGFTTVFVSNQVPDHANIDAFAGEADRLIRVADYLKTERHPCDNEALPILKEVINATNDPLLLVFHTYGSHYDYTQRYGPEDAVFTPDTYSGLTYREREKLLNAYDNSICMIDRMLSDLIEMINDSTLCSSMLYLSDHGEDLMDDSRKMILHCSTVPTYYQVHVPMIAWFSEQYKMQFPEKATAAVNNRAMPISSNAVFHTLLDMASIASTHKDSTLSIVSNHFARKVRYFINEHDEPVDFQSVGFKLLDWNMIQQMELSF